MVYLKSFVIFLICPIFVFSKVDIPPDLQAEIDDYFGRCFQKIGITYDNLKAYKMGDRDPKIMCFTRCLFIEAKWMDEDENLQYDYIKDTVHHAVRHITIPELENCGKKTVGDKCEKSFNFFMCMNQAEPEDWVFV